MTDLLDMITILDNDELLNSPTSPLEAVKATCANGFTYVIIREHDDLSDMDRHLSAQEIARSFGYGDAPSISYGAALAGNYTILREEHDGSLVVVDPLAIILASYATPQENSE